MPPVTRHASGSQTLGQLMFGDGGDPSSSDEATTTPPTETTETTDTASTPKESTTTTSAPTTGPPPPRRPTNSTSKSKSIRTTSSRRALRLAQAREEALKIKLELAQARIATLEAEESEDDDRTVLSTHEKEQRVDEWLESSRLVLAIANEPHHEEDPELATPQNPPPPAAPARDTQPAAAGPSNATAERTGLGARPAAAAAVHVGATAPLNADAPAYVPVYVPAPQQRCSYEETGRLPPPIYAKEEEPKNNSMIALSQQNISITELASAIAIAAQSGHRNSSRYNIDLPQFNGSSQEWLSFKAAYAGSATTYSDADNVARLRKSPKGRAKEAVENLLIYNVNSDEIMKALESRFGRTDSIARAELERLRTLPRLTDAPQDICIFACRLNNTMATLKALDRTHYLHSPETTKAMMDKLTPALRYRWFDYAAAQRNEEPELIKLAAFLQREADNCAAYAQPENIDNHVTSHPSRRTQKAFVTTDKPSNKCPVCSEAGHYIEKCKKFLQEDINARWETAKNQRLCFRCLRYRNKMHNCRRVKCEQDSCEHFHHKLLHYTKPQERSTESVASTWAPAESRAYLKILPIEISGPAGVLNTYALLDDGSTVTLIHEDIAKEAGLDGPTEPLQKEAITNETIDASRSRRVTLHIRGVNQEHKIYARTINDLHLSSQSIKQEDLHACEHLQDIEKYLKYNSAKPKMIIGQDNWHLLVSNEMRRGQRHQPVASLTPLGWVLHGAHTRIIGKRVHTMNCVISRSNEDMNKQLAEYFALESLLVEPKRPQSDPEERALTTLAKLTTVNKDGRYEVPLLWQDEDAPLPDNYDNTLKRLQNVERKLDRDEGLKKRYHEEMDALLKKGYAEPAPPNKENKVWYLPHFAVINPMKPDKVRIVHDAAARTRGVCLNDRLLTGPDLLQSLPGVLMRFRQHPVAVGADIKEMFMQVKIRECDRDALRYLWRGDDRDASPPQEYRMTSLIFGATCSPSIAIYIKNTNAQKYEKTHPEAVKSIIRNHYVDDYLQSFKSEAEAIQTAGDVRHIHEQAHYELRQWTSNSTRVLAAVAEKPTQPVHIDLNKTEMKNERVLGQIWKPATDEIAFNLDLSRLPPDALEAKPTKRHVLKITMSVFDPLGLATPVTIKAKKILQEVWRRGTDWDEQLPEDLTQQWTEWTQHLKALREVAIPRCYLRYSDAVARELHVFVDASETAYTSALYWRLITADNEVHVSLIAAKAKVAPLKITSIPRLELQAAVLGSRMAASVVDEHDYKPTKRTFWTDSRTVLAWLRAGARSYRPFVAHRIAAIEENSTIQEWRWVPTKLNVADEATREVPKDFNNEHRWFAGPEFLRDDPSSWPTEPSQLHSENTGEKKVHLIVENCKHSWLPAPDRFSRWERLLRTIARVLQFIDLCRPQRARTHYKRTSKNKQIDPEWSRIDRKKKTKTSSRHLHEAVNYKKLDATYLQRAEQLIVRASQHDVFTEELRCLQNNKAPPTSSRLRPLAVELVNGTITLKTRIGAADGITESQKRPPVLDGNHAYVKLYIDYVHRQLQHGGVEATINECKQHYCILRLRPVARMVLHRCLPCRIKKATPAVPPTGNHPRSRLAHHERPFTYTGIDYFGPLTVTVGRGTQKRYVALFTCLTVRAVHLEVVPSLSGDSAVMALRRMIARRGCPTEIWSDNGTNFHAADKELRHAFNESTQEEAAKHLIKWRFIPPSAPFMGGAWERMVKAVKNSLGAVLEERHPSDETLSTLLAEAEYTVNSRPLTHVSVDPCEPESITPNHFLLGGTARVPVPGTFDDSHLVGRATWRTSQRLADHFWSRWVREYLPTLQDRREPHGRGPPIEVGNIVLIADGTLPRNTWPRGRVVAVYPGPDGVTRAVDVRTLGGVLRRPTKKLVVLPTEPGDPHHDIMQRFDGTDERCTAGEMCGTP